MLYIATTKTLDAKALPQLAENDRVSVFYKAGDAIKVQALAALAEIGVFPADYQEYADRDDMLVLLGSCLASTEEEVMLLDPSVPVPKRYAGRVKAAKTPARAKKKGAEKASPARRSRKVPSAGKQEAQTGKEADTEAAPAAGKDSGKKKGAAAGTGGTDGAGTFGTSGTADGPEGFPMPEPEPADAAAGLTEEDGSDADGGTKTRNTSKLQKKWEEMKAKREAAARKTGSREPDGQMHFFEAPYPEDENEENEG